MDNFQSILDTIENETTRQKVEEYVNALQLELDVCRKEIVSLEKIILEKDEYIHFVEHTNVIDITASSAKIKGNENAGKPLSKLRRRTGDGSRAKTVHSVRRNFVKKPVRVCTDEEKGVRVAVLCRRFLAQRRYQRLRRKVRLALEFLETENNYNKQLHVIIDLFLEPLKILELIPVDALKIIFSEKELTIIMAYNEQLEKSLRKVINDDLNYYTRIGPVLTEITAFFKSYSTYINNYERSIQTLEITRNRYPLFNEYLAAHEGNNKYLAYFLVTPIQRPPRYVMLITDILRNTPHDHPDFEELQSSLIEMSKVADFLNTKKGEANDTLKINNILDRLTFANREDQDIINHLREVPTRQYLGDLKAELIVQKKKDKCNIYIFNDFVLFSKTLRNKDKYKFHFIFSEETTWQLGEEENTLILEDGKTECSITIISVEINEVLVLVKSAVEKITRLVDNRRSIQKTHAPEDKSFSQKAKLITDSLRQHQKMPHISMEDLMKFTFNSSRGIYIEDKPQHESTYEQKSSPRDKKLSPRDKKKEKEQRPKSGNRQKRSATVSIPKQLSPKQ